MLGERFILRDEYRRPGRDLLRHLLPRIDAHDGRFALSIAGESGSGKTVMAHVTAQLLAEQGHKAVILSQDDYFRLPPISNDAYRRQHLEWVGPGEVDLALMDDHLAAALAGAAELHKPLIIYTDDLITEEVLRLDGVDVILAEGTYVSLLDRVQCRVFLTRDYHATKADRHARARDALDEFVESVLEIEHGIISAHRSRADLIITDDYHVHPANPPGSPS